MGADAEQVAADSTPAELQQIYLRNVGYDTGDDITKANRFIEACRAIIALPTESTSEGEGVRFNRELISNQLDDALKWARHKAAASTGPRYFQPDSRYSQRWS